MNHTIEELMLGNSPQIKIEREGRKVQCAELREMNGRQLATCTVTMQDAQLSVKVVRKVIPVWKRTDNTEAIGYDWQGLHAMPTEDALNPDEISAIDILLRAYDSTKAYSPEHGWTV